MENVYVRKAKIKDLDSIIDLASQLWETEQVFNSNLADFYYKTKEGTRGLKKDIRNRDMIFLVAVINNNVIGFLNGYINKGSAYKNKIAHLDRLCVDKPYRNRGVSRLLLETFETQLKKSEVGSIRLNAFEKNIPAVSFYKKEGFYEYSTTYMKKL